MRIHTVVIAALVVGAVGLAVVPRSNSAPGAGGLCTRNSDCLDGDPCNGTEYCEVPDAAGKRYCKRSEPLTCSSGDACLPGTGCVATCNNDAACSDGIFCNGAEVCAKIGAISTCQRPDRGFVCGRTETCDEAKERCLPECSVPQDADGDSYRAQECGGSDCDDHDASRFPGNNEVCDSRGHDEDCDPSTIGDADGDRDGDGHLGFACCNAQPGGGKRCGNDCDDNNPAIAPGAQRCGVGDKTVLLCSSSGQWDAASCPVDGTVCIRQPNQTGICQAPPPGWTGVKVLPRPPTGKPTPPIPTR